jgi:LuxR family maltose regulon positive regulatory protein
METPLLQTKLYIPPTRPELVPRPRLIERLNVGLNRKLTLVSAPAGYGKTTLLSEWVAQIRDQIAWLSLDKEDNDPVCFWAYVIAALQTVHTDPSTSSGQALSQNALQVLKAPQPPPVQSILTPLLNDIAALPDRVVLVLDDYHVISTQAIHDGIAFLLAHQPPQLHLVLSTRADPPLPIARLRGRGQLTELRADDLRFTADEAAAFLNTVMDLDLPPEDVKALAARTEGWIVGLQLAALSMQGRDDTHEFITAFTGSHHYVLEYLTEEVLRRQPEPVQQFLLQTSILDRLCGPLCNAVTREGDGETTLASLQRANLFIIPLDEKHHWYRYHHLFSDLLGSHLKHEMPLERILELHRRASAWYEQNGAIDEAVKHALQAQDFERAAFLIEQAAGTILSRGSVTTLLRWSEALPEELVLARPGLRMYQGWAAFLSGQTALAGQILLDTKEALQAMSPSPDREVFYGRLTALLATLATLHQDMPKAIEEGQEALAHLPEEDLIWRARATRALGAAYKLSGDTNKLIQMCNEAKSLALAAGSIFLAVDIISQLASAQFHQGRLRQAARSYRQILDLVEHPSRFPPAGLGYIGLADVSLEWNDLDAAGDYVNRGIDLCQQGGIGHNLLLAYGTKALVRQAQEDTEGALEAI